MLPDKEDGEIGELYRNYEDMRLRLKESTDEKIFAEKQNKELVSNISHDLKTPITAIKGYVEGIMDGVADTPEKMDKYIKTIYNKANDMDRLINELTVYSGIDSNRIPYHFHRINVSEYFGDCIEEVGLDLESKNIELNYSNLVPPDTMVIADPEQLKRVINNIIGNSIKYLDKPKGRLISGFWMKWMPSGWRLRIMEKELPQKICLRYLKGFTGQMRPGIHPREGAVLGCLL